MTLTRGARSLLAVATVLVLLFLYAPLVIVVLNSFNASKSFAFPPTGWTGKWWSAALHNHGALSALLTSVQAGLAAMAIAVVLGTMAAFAVQRYRFFGRSTISFLVVIPIALPGVVTGIALQTAINHIFVHVGINIGLMTVIIGHATFCIVVVFNNVQARLRRLGGSLQEASSDLGARGWQTFFLITLPAARGALVAGALLAFGLSFDEIIVTTFTAGSGVQTLPLWIFANLFRPNQAPVVTVVATVLIVVAVIPVWLAQRLSDDVTGGRA